MNILTKGMGVAELCRVWDHEIFLYLAKQKPISINPRLARFFDNLCLLKSCNQGSVLLKDLVLLTHHDFQHVYNKVNVIAG